MFGLLIALVAAAGLAAGFGGALCVRRRTDRFAERAKDQKTAKALRALGSEVVAPYFEARARGEGIVRLRAILDNVEEVVTDPEKRAEAVERLLKFHFAKAVADPDALAWIKKEIAKVEAAAKVTAP